jgi:hypothetical protein
MNSSAHLSYAGALLEQENRSYPFASESLLARLLQPANANTFNTFNEYTTFFEQPSTEGEITLRAGNLGRSDAELIVYGAVPENNFAYNFGLLGSMTDGWRETNFDNFASAAFIGKWDSSDKDSLFFSTLFAKTRQGDEQSTANEFDSTSEPGDRTASEVIQIEIGHRHKISPSSDFLTYFSHNENEFNIFDNTRTLVTAPSLFSDEDNFIDAKRPYSQLQFQYSLKTDKHQIITGVLAFTGNAKADNTINLALVDG